MSRATKATAWALGLLSLSLFLSAPAQAQEAIFEAAALQKACEGKYKGPGETETIITVQCESWSSDCKCSNGKVTCGTKEENSKDAPKDSTLVTDSCKQTFFVSSASQ